MLKQVITCMLLIAFALQTFNKVVMLFDYQFNTQSYIKDCENKARPQLHCDGQCKLMKKLKKEADKEEQNPERKAENKNEIVVFAQSFTPVDRLTVLLSSNLFVAPSIGSEVRMPRFILHPPCC